MSFIRCTSNPEGLYVYHSVGGFIAFHYNGMKRSARISLRDWGLLKRTYRANPWGDLNGKRLRVHRDIRVDGKDREVNTPRQFLRSPRTYLKTRLSVKDGDQWRTFYLWDVTYDYLVGGAVRRDDWAAKRLTMP